jgi:hypothetical protein
MRALIEGFLSIFTALGDILTLGNSRESHEIRQILDRSRQAQSWYHAGPWWEHPIYGDAWKEKK